MKLKLWAAAIGALLAVPVSALAQQSPHVPDPADPRVAVPPAQYESAITSTAQPRTQQSELTPDKVWRTANDIVGQAPGHAGHGAGPAPASNQAHTGHEAPVSDAKPVVQPAADHSKHH